MKPTLMATFFCIALTSCERADRHAAPGNSSGEAPSNAGQRLGIEATVAAVSEGAAWHHYTDGAFEVFDAVTFSVTRPRAMRGQELTVYYEPNRLPKESPLRKTGTRCRFQVAAEFLEPSKPGESRELHEPALEDLTVLTEEHP